MIPPAILALGRPGERSTCTARFCRAIAGRGLPGQTGFLVEGQQGDRRLAFTTWWKKPDGRALLVDQERVAIDFRRPPPSTLFGKLEGARAAPCSIRALSGPSPWEPRRRRPWDLSQGSYRGGRQASRRPQSIGRGPQERIYDLGTRRDPPPIPGLSPLCGGQRLLVWWGPAGGRGSGVPGTVTPPSTGRWGITVAARGAVCSSSHYPATRRAAGSLPACSLALTGGGSRRGSVLGS